MKRLAFLCIVCIFLGSTVVQSQVTNENRSVNIYKDRVTDEKGKPIMGLTVRVKGQNQRTRTNANGEFSIAANYGDIIILSKDGEVINSYTYNGQMDYEVEDRRDLGTPRNKKRSLSAPEKKESFNYLDSAKYYLNRIPSKSIDFIEKALLESSEQKDKIKASTAYEILGDVNFGIKQYDIAVGNYVLAIEQNQSTIDLRIKLGNALLMQGRLTESESEFSSQLKEKKLNNYQEILIYQGLGDVYLKQNKSTKAQQAYETGLDLAKNIKHISKITELNSKIAGLLELKGETNKAEGYLLNSQDAAAKSSKREVIVEQQKAADFYSRNNILDKEVVQRKATLKNLEEAESEDIVFDDEVVSKPKAKLDLGNAYLKQNKFKDAIPLLEESANEAKKIDDIITQKDAFQSLSEAYVSLGEDDKALMNYKEYVNVVDKVYKQKEREISAVVALNKDLSDKQNRINSLEKDRELTQSKYQLSRTQKELTEQNDRRQRLIIYSLLAGLILLLFSLFWMIKSNRQRKLANNLLALKSLRTQMNPHFIFNALNSVNSFIAQNDERTANRYLTDFSTLMRSVLNNSEEDFISLEQEIDLLALYLKLEHSRFEDKFEYLLDVDENIDQTNFQIPPMLLQPYVENAVWHGLRYKKEKGKLEIKISRIDEESIQIVISDNGIGRKQSKALKTDYQKKQKSKGMQNIKQRIEILNEMYKDKIDVTINDLYDDKTGTKVVLYLKKD